MFEWIHALSAWAIAHKEQLALWSTLASALGAIASASAALVVMALTRTLARDNRILRKAGTEPEIIAYLLPDQRHINIMNLVVANVGRGPARNIELEFTGNVELLRKNGARIPILSRQPILPWLPQDERFVQIFGNTLDLWGDERPPAFQIIAHFSDAAGNRKTTTSQINLADFDGLSRLQPPEHEVAEALKAIAKTVEGWNGFTRLKVETMTADEVAKRDQARYDEIMERRNQKLANKSDTVSEAVEK